MQQEIPLTKYDLEEMDDDRIQGRLDLQELLSFMETDSAGAVGFNDWLINHQA